MRKLFAPWLGLAIAVSMPAQAQERFTNPVGGTGGQQYVLRCPSGTLVTGVAALTGAYINNIAPICDGRTMPGAGSNGNQRSAACPLGSAVDKIFIISLRSPNHLLKALELFCVARGSRQATASVRLDTPGVYTAPFNPQSLNYFLPRIKAPGYPTATIDCGNRPIIGLQGRAGAAVDALGLICG